MIVYDYGIIGIEPKKNYKKIICIILIAILAAIICFCAGILIVRIYNKTTLNQEQRQNIVEEKKDKKEQDRQQLEEQKRLEEEKKIKEQKEAEERKRLRNKDELTEEQMEKIENIYDDTTEKRVFLTFDDGPTQTVTPLILDLLKEENIKATFFVLGNRVYANPELVQREFDEGHYIANHGYSHVYRDIYSSIDNVFEEYNYTEEAIQTALNNPDYHSRLFRFPGGSTGGYYRVIKAEAKEALRDSKIVSLDWNCLSRDAEGADSVEELLDNVLETIEGKDSVVILMHDASDKILTYEALPEIINYLREEGYSFKNIYDIL